MLNRIILMGRLTRDPELRHTQTGTPVASFSLAVDRDFKDKSTGEKATDFIDIVAWRSTAEFVSRFFTKGRLAVVEDRPGRQQAPQRRGGSRQRLFRRLQTGRRGRRQLRRLFRSRTRQRPGRSPCLLRPHGRRRPVRRAG